MNEFSGLSSEERKMAQRISELGYTPCPENFAAEVMKRIERKKARKNFWTWLVTPRPLRIAPLWPAVAAVCLVALAVTLSLKTMHYEPASLERTGSGPAEYVQFHIRMDGAREISLIGSFNNWQSPGFRLSRDDCDGSWSVSIPLSPGRHEYAFVVDGSHIVADPEALLHNDDGFGNVNSVVVIEEDDYEHQHQL